jgi:hypothetical protein
VAGGLEDCLPFSQKAYQFFLSMGRVGMRAGMAAMSGPLFPTALLAIQRKPIAAPFMQTLRSAIFNHTCQQRTTTVFALNEGSVGPDEIVARAPVGPEKALYNEELAPTPASQRTYTTFDMAAWWVALVVNVTTWSLAGGLVQQGSWLHSLGRGLVRFRISCACACNLSP